MATKIGAFNRNEEIERLASELIKAYHTNRSVTLSYFKALRGNLAKNQDFNLIARDYYKWLLFAVPEPYREDVNKKVQDLRPEMKSFLENIIPPGVILHQKNPEKGRGVVAELVANGELTPEDIENLYKKGPSDIYHHDD